MRVQPKFFNNILSKTDFLRFLALRESAWLVVIAVRGGHAYCAHFLLVERPIDFRAVFVLDL